MAFENVDANRLLNDLNNCKSDLNYNYTKNLISSLNSNIWICNSKVNVINALKKLTSDKYKILENKIDECINNTNKIIEYKELQYDNQLFRKEIEELKPNLWSKRYYTTSFVDSNGETIYENKSEDVYNHIVANQINDLQNKIEINNSKMEKLEKEINSFC